MSNPYEGLTTEQLRDVIDAQPIIVGSSSKAEVAADSNRYTFYDTPDDYLKGIESMGVEEPKPWLDHELSHGICALKVGVKSVRYAVVNKPVDINGHRIWLPDHLATITEGPVSIPRLALAAIKAAPKAPSVPDLRVMKKLLYPSVEDLEERITKWNNNDTGLTIPLPGTIDISI